MKKPRSGNRRGAEMLLIGMGSPVIGYVLGLIVSNMSSRWKLDRHLSDFIELFNDSVFSMHMKLQRYLPDYEEINTQKLLHETVAAFPAARVLEFLSYRVKTWAVRLTGIWHKRLLLS